jgi:DMSO/TMAO reductase YedYZ molybdopterin-dependent catalytic subunit
MFTQAMSRRELLKKSGVTLAGMTFLSHPLLAQAFQTQPGEVVIPWLDQPAENPVPEIAGNLLRWEELDSWITPNNEFFYVAHYGQPTVSESDWRLGVAGLVRQPLTLTLDDLRARPQQELDFTIECSGNHGLPFLTGAIGNARWTGTSLASLLEEAGVQEDGVEVVFFGRDAGDMVVRDVPIRQHFARSMSLEDAMSPHNLLAYEMNGEPLPQANGYPLRLITPGWYGIANVKWLERIELRSSRYMGHFMARDYVTIREEERNGETEWVETSVGRALLKSVPAKVSHSNGDYRIMGAAWGAPIERVEVQIDHGPWQEAQLGEGHGDEFTWTFWQLGWEDATPGEHDITSRAIDSEGNIQPAPEDPVIANKHTYWESNQQVTRRVVIS